MINDHQPQPQTMQLQDLIQLHAYFVQVKDPSATIRQITSHLEDQLKIGITFIRTQQGQMQ